MEGPDPCQLQIDALLQAEIEFNQALQTMIERADALIACREEHPEEPPAPMAMMKPSKRMQVDVESNVIRASVAAIVRIVKE